MTTIKASCPVCGDVELNSEQLRLVVCNIAKRSYMSFFCGGCESTIEKPVGPEVITKLVDAGVVAERWVVPAEALEEHAGAPFTPDDLLDLGLFLRNDKVDLMSVLEASYGLRG